MGKLILIDEVLDPRFLALLARRSVPSPVAASRATISSSFGITLRRWTWDKGTARAVLPPEITWPRRQAKYLEAFHRLTGRDL